MRHRFHSICPYFAMFPESFVEKWIGLLAKPGDVVLDPFCGRGTTPFQALLMDREAIACDVNPVAYCITKAKVTPPSLSDIRRRITIIEGRFRSEEWEQQRKTLPRFFHYAFHPRTLRQLLFLRESLNWRRSELDCFIAALVLGSLHGESQKSNSYLSNQMPRTISTKPAYSIRYWKEKGLRAPERDTFDILRRRATFRFESEPPKKRGVVLLTDMRELPRKAEAFDRPIRCAVTSPPYLNVTNYEEDQWLRLWFLGGMPYPTYGLVSKDDRHECVEKYWDLISDMWRVLGQVLTSRANIVIRLGGKGISPMRMGKGLHATSIFSQRKVRLIHQEESNITGRQTDSFRPGSKGCLVEVDYHFQMA